MRKTNRLRATPTAVTEVSECRFIRRVLSHDLDGNRGILVLAYSLSREERPAQEYPSVRRGNGQIGARLRRLRSWPLRTISPNLQEPLPEFIATHRKGHVLNLPNPKMEVPPVAILGQDEDNLCPPIIYSPVNFGTNPLRGNRAGSQDDEEPIARFKPRPNRAFPIGGRGNIFDRVPRFNSVVAQRRDDFAFNESPILGCVANEDSWHDSPSMFQAANRHGDARDSILFAAFCPPGFPRILTDEIPLCNLGLRRDPSQVIGLRLRPTTARACSHACRLPLQ